MFCKRIVLIFISLVAIFLFVSCHSSKQDEKLVDIRIKHIRSLISANKLDEAKSEIDSIHVLFPRYVQQRKLAVALKDTILLRESKLAVFNCNKMLSELTEAYKILLKNVFLIKNDKYDNIGRYVYKSKDGEQNEDRNYLKYELDENGDTYLTSLFSGSKLKHISIQVSALSISGVGKFTANTKGVFHSFVEGEKNYEQLTFKNENDNGIAKFVSENKNAAIQVTLSGIKKYTYTLQKNDKEAISQIFKLAQTQKILRKTEKNLRIAQQRIGKINLLYQKN